MDSFTRQEYIVYVFWIIYNFVSNLNLDNKFELTSRFVLFVLYIFLLNSTQYSSLEDRERDRERERVSKSFSRFLALSYLKQLVTLITPRFFLFH